MEPLLYGHNADEHIVAVHPADDSSMRVYHRVDDRLAEKLHEFFPFFHLADASLLSGFPGKHWIRDLGTEGYYRYLCVFTRWSDMWNAVRRVLDTYGRQQKKRFEHYGELDLLYLKADPVVQFLLHSGMTMFKGMEFADIHRLQLDIETYASGGSRYSNPNRADDRIIIIALSDNRGWQHVIDGRHMDEASMFREATGIIRDRDPDIIEGHNILHFDIPYILQRCVLHGTDFPIGRDGSSPKPIGSPAWSPDRPVEASSYEIAGRHILDTLNLVQAYDATRHSLESYGLKYVARYFGFAKTDRLYIAGDRISWYWDHEPDLLIRYALDDVEETTALSDLLAPGTFTLSQMVPYPFGALSRLGSAAKIESLMLREYLRQKRPLPAPQVQAQTTGGYTDLFFTGVLGPVLHVDMESLYPSIMLVERIGPASDLLNIFHSLLEVLTKTRLDAKRSMTGEVDPIKRRKLDVFQSAMKILINSFYGYLGYGRGLFNDIAAADRVTQTGQKLLRDLMTVLGERGGKVIEVDTDGVYFVPPRHVNSESLEQEYVSTIASTLPSGIQLRIDGRYLKMLSYKKKNYALLGYDQRITIKGSSLVSRSIEKFGRNFIHQCIDALLHENIAALHELYLNLRRDIMERKLTVEDFARTETLRDPPEVYEQEIREGRRNRTASYEVAISSLRLWRTGDKISYYITGADENVKGFENCKNADSWNPDLPDENTAYYLRRLDEFVKKFEGFFSPRDFHAIFSTDDLFGFSATGMGIRTLPFRDVETGGAPEEGETSSAEPRIWLSE